MKKARLVSFVAIIVSLSFAGSAAAQSRFSQAQAQTIINRQDWNGLLAYGKACVQAEPNNGDAWLVIGRAYGSKYYHIGLEQPQNAVPAFQRLVQVKPQWPDGWNALGTVEQEVGQWKESAIAFERATQLAPERPHYWDMLVGSYMHTHQFPQAASAAANVEKYARTASDWFQAGAAYYGVGPYYEPTAMYQRS